MNGPKGKKEKKEEANKCIFETTRLENIKNMFISKNGKKLKKSTLYTNKAGFLSKT